jgi:outer membrane protein assembly factor BamA
MVLSFQYTRSLTEQRDQYSERYTLTGDLGYDFFHVSYPSDWGRGMRASLTTELQRERKRNLVHDGERPPFGDPVDSVTLGPGLDIDKRDSPLHPTRGWLLRQANEVLFGTSALTPDEIQPSFRETITAQYVQSFFDRRLIIAPTFRVGAVQTDKPEADLKSNFLFKAGGDGVAIPVRGYADAAIDACGGVKTDTGFCKNARDVDDNPVPVGGKALIAGSLELRFPTFVVDDFWFTVFADVAAVAPDFEEMGTDRFYPSVGAGLRWLVTGQIPLRIDVGLPLRTNDLNPEREPRLHLAIFYPL